VVPHELQHNTLYNLWTKAMWRKTNCSFSRTCFYATSAFSLLTGPQRPHGLCSLTSGLCPNRLHDRNKKCLYNGCLLEKGEKYNVDVFWNVLPRSLEEIYPCFIGDSWGRMMEAVSTAQAEVNICHSTRHNIPDHSRRKNFKSQQEQKYLKILHITVGLCLYCKIQNIMWEGIFWSWVAGGSIASSELTNRTKEVQAVN